MQQILIHQLVAASPDKVWAMLTDHSQFARWSGVKEVVLRQRGYPEADGVGAIRVIRDHGVAVEEEITAYEAPKRLAYRLISGAPIRDHSGELRLEPQADRTQVTWEVLFEPKIPGTGALIRWVVGRQLAQVLVRLARQFKDNDA